MPKVCIKYLFAVSSPVSLTQLVDQLELLEAEAEKEIQAAIDTDSLEKLRVNLLGKKGRLSGVLGAMGRLSAVDRPLVGKRANALKSQLQELMFERLELLQKK